MQDVEAVINTGSKFVCARKLPFTVIVSVVAGSRVRLIVELFFERQKINKAASETFDTDTAPHCLNA